jgi:hypothetical protein
MQMQQIVLFMNTFMIYCRLEINYVSSVWQYCWNTMHQTKEKLFFILWHEKYNSWQEKVKKFSGDGWQECYAIIIITYVIKGSKTAGRVHTHIYHIWVMQTGTLKWCYLNMHDNNIETCPQLENCSWARTKIPSSYLIKDRENDHCVNPGNASIDNQNSIQTSNNIIVQCQ